MKIHVGRTIFLDTKVSIALKPFDIGNYSEVEFIGVKLDFIAKPEIFKFESAEKLFKFGENRDNFFCYINTVNEIYTLERRSEDEIIGGINVYNINSKWNLFVNSMNRIVVQQNKNAFTTTYFRGFPLTETFFVYLSYLYYCLRNCDLESGEEIKLKFESILNV